MFATAKELGADLMVPSAFHHSRWRRVHSWRGDAGTVLRGGGHSIVYGALSAHGGAI